MNQDIKQASEMVGVSASTLRRWEREGRLPFKPNRLPNGRRDYSLEQIHLLKAISINLHFSKEKI